MVSDSYCIGFCALYSRCSRSLSRFWICERFGVTSTNSIARWSNGRFPRRKRLPRRNLINPSIRPKGKRSEPGLSFGPQAIAKSAQPEFHTPKNRFQGYSSGRTGLVLNLVLERPANITPSTDLANKCQNPREPAVQVALTRSKGSGILRRPLTTYIFAHSKSYFPTTD